MLVNIILFFNHEIHVYCDFILTIQLYGIYYLNFKFVSIYKYLCDFEEYSIDSKTCLSMFFNIKFETI